MHHTASRGDFSMLCTRCRIRTAVTDDGLCTFCSGTRPPLPDGLMAPVAGPGGWGVATWPRSPVGLARAVTALLGLVIAADLFAIGTGLRLRALWQGLVTDGSLDIYGRDGDTAERLYGIAALAQGVTLLATGVVFIIWFHRTRRNAEVFDPSVQRMGPGWAVGGWFVPIANFWFPYRVASGVWEASAQTRPDGGWRTVPGPRSTCGGPRGSRVSSSPGSPSACGIGPRTRRGSCRPGAWWRPPTRWTSSPPSSPSSTSAP
ncbi:protein of unknown function [Streptomyces sp. Termitarium-T10T-6]|nr:protein of unknown function [Streptomyces sp. Termitarium-T10T-6]